MPKVLVVNGSPQYYKMFMDFGWEVFSDPTTDVPDLVCFTGGSDVSSSFYGEPKHPTAWSDIARDLEEQSIFKDCVEMDIPMVGICRGGQFLNVMNGGKMFQDVSKHTRSHPIKDCFTGEVVFASSTHHQMMRPGHCSTLVATANEGGYKEHMGDTGIIRSSKQEPDVEVVFYSNTASLCFQPHPEFYNQEKLQEYFFSLIHRYLLIKE